MAKRLTKTQRKRMYQAIHDKAFKLLGQEGGMSVADYTAISKICNKYLKKC